jgi:hypothetical protein
VHRLRHCTERAIATSHDLVSVGDAAIARFAGTPIRRDRVVVSRRQLTLAPSLHDEAAMRSIILGVVKAVVALSVVAACGSVQDAEPPSQSDGHDLFSEHQGMESQGRTLLGTFVDAFGPTMPDHANVLTDAHDADGNPITLELAGAASLRSGDHVGGDPFFDGVVMQVDQGGELMLHTSPDRGGTDVSFYKLLYRATPSDPWADPCLDPDGSSVYDDAVPYAGTWSRAGLHSTTPGRISFACEGGVAYKCATWGFVAGGDETSLAFRANQACTRMARADYCSNGHSHTREGTLIKIFDLAGVIGPPTTDDLAGVKHWAPDPANYFFEAAWNDGDKPVSCLSRLRWQSLPILGEDGDGNACPDAIVHDPRTNASAFCEDMQFTGTDGPLLFNASTYNDLELHIWQNGTDLASTVQGYFEPTGISQQPFPSGSTALTHLVRDGMLLRKRPQNPLGVLVEVHLYANGTDTYMAESNNPPAGYTDISTEGFVYKDKPNANYVSFDLWNNPTTGDNISTAVKPAPASYNFVRTIGWILPPEAKDPPQD